MVRRWSFLMALSAVLVLGLPQISRADTVALDFTGGSTYTNFDGTDMTIGWGFVVNEAISVTELGFYDLDADGLGQSHLVGIWDSAGNLVASVTIQADSPLTGTWRYEAVTPVTLVAGETYNVGAEINDPFSDRYYTSADSVFTASEITYDGPRRNDSSGGFSNPYVTSTSPYPNGRFGPNFKYETTSVPEPGAAALLVGGLLAGGAVLRRRVRK